MTLAIIGAIIGAFCAGFGLGGMHAMRRWRRYISFARAVERMFAHYGA